jgi:hypothetical protein
MEKRKKGTLKGVQMAVYKEDPNAVKGIALSGSGAATGKVDPFAAKDFVMIKQGVQDVPYTESRIDGPDDIHGEPIHEDDEPERAILIMGVPAPGADWTMRINLNNSAGQSEEVKVCRINGKYDQLYTSNLAAGAKVIKESPGLYFTVKTMKGGFVTYQNINQPDTVVQITHRSAACFDLFKMSFLGLSSK